MNPSSDLFGWAILFATFAGPFFAVIVTRIVDNQRADKERKKSIFRTLMSNRASRLSPEAIQAQNLIEIDFIKNKNVVNAWHDYFSHLRLQIPTNPDGARNFYSQRNHLYVLLLDRMAKSLGYKFEQMSILEGGYYPDGAVEIETDNQAVRQLFASISRGERALPISVENIPEK